MNLQVHHPHAVRFFGACTKRQPYMIVTEFLPGGSLADVFAKCAAAPTFVHAAVCKPQLAAQNFACHSGLHSDARRFPRPFWFLVDCKLSAQAG